MSVFLFWLSLATIVYAYVIFPLLVFVRGVLASRPYAEGDVQPTVSVIIAAYNEAGVIGKKLESVLRLDYPRECLHVIVASDGSTDGTNAMVKRYEHQGVRLLALPRVGKAAALNAAAAEATGEVLVFSDANSIFAPSTLRALVRPFADPEVGGVAGNQRYTEDGEPTPAGAGESAYWAFDRQLKIYESRAGNTISATGALYALRRYLFQGIPDGVTDDFYNSVGVVAQGYRLVFAPEAVAYEAVAGSGGTEFRRKVRVITRGLTAVAMRRQLLNPLRYGWYAWQMFSHKIARRLVVFPLMALAILGVRLRRRSWLYKLAAGGQALFYGVAALGALWDRKGRGLPKLFILPYYFVLVNVAALVAIANLVRGRRIVKWT